MQTFEETSQTKNAEVVDIFDLMTQLPDTDDDSLRGTMSADDALFHCLNVYARVDLAYIAMLCDKSVYETAQLLQGAIYQDPAPFLQGEAYDIAENWMPCARYLSGNVQKKLDEAMEARSRFGDLFDSNVEMLKRICPAHVGIDGIHVALGASWIPTQEVEAFLKQFLRLRKAPEVLFFEDLLTYKIVAPAEAKNSVRNNIVYGVQADSGKQYLTALDIVERTMNAKTPKVTDYLPRASGFGYQPHFNRQKTVEAQEKQRQICEAFCDFVYGDPYRAARFEEYYNQTLVGYTYAQYDGSFLKLPDLNPAVSLYRHQRDAVARVLLSEGNLMLAHDVGTGKSYEIIISAHELHRMGKSEKNLIVVPNNVLHAMVKMHADLYPNDAIFAVYPKDFTPEKRNRVLEKIRDGKFVAIYMAYSSFEMVTMSKAYYVRKMSDEIAALTTAIFNATDRHERSRLQAKQNEVQKKLQHYHKTEPPCPWLNYEALGITTLFVDEAHNFKNIPIYSQTEGIVGMGSSSKKCREMLEKAHNTKRVIFATGTPLTNSLSDLYAFQTYLQPDTLAFHKMNSFDTWINTFGKLETAIECDVDASSATLRTTTRFSSFHNLGELMGMFSQVCDFHHQSEAEEGLPYFAGPIDISVARNAAQAAYMKQLSERTELIRARGVSRNEDNLLKVTNDGRLAALDIRLADATLQTAAVGASKADACAQKVYELYCAHPDSVQVIFSDIGTPKAGFNIYDELAQKLVRLGVAREEIAFVHDATTEQARAKLFAAMNQAKVRVAIGSTQKLGVGVNVQEKLIALHHLSVPWRPSDMVQREGRILRKGNTSPQVYIFRYVTEGSFDAYSWQILENKQKFISAFLAGESGRREADDIADAVLSYAEVKALAIGNPLIKARVETANNLERTKIAFRARQKELLQLQAALDAYPQKIEQVRNLAKLAKADYIHYKNLKQVQTNEARVAFGKSVLDAVSQYVGKSEEQVFGKYQHSATVILPANLNEAHPYIIIEGAYGGRYPCDLSGDEKTPLGCVRSIESLLEHLGQRAEELARQREQMQSQQQAAKADLEKGNDYELAVTKLECELNRIDRHLEEQAAS